MQVNRVIQCVKNIDQQFTRLIKQIKKKASSVIEMEKMKHPKLITKELDFVRFKRSDKVYLNYYKKNPEAPFCVNYIDPKLKRIFNSHKNLIK